MDKELIRETAAAMLSQELLYSWQTYALMAAIWVLFKVLDGWFGPYLSKRAEALATKADFDTAMAQIRETTKITEGIRADIARTDWIEKEWRTIRRLKLEELLNNAYAALDSMKFLPLNRFENPDHQPMNNLRMLCSLYFPELRPQISALYVPFHDLAIHSLDCKSVFDKAARSHDAENLKQVSELHGRGWEMHFTRFVAAHTDLEVAASDLMIGIAQNSSTS